MGFLRILIVIGIVGFAVHWWKDRDVSHDRVAHTSPNGFVSAVMPEGAGPKAVVILAPVNCPSDAAQRADALSARLTELGIPNVRSSSYTASVTDPSDEQRAAMQRSLSVLKGEIPAVFLHGMAKANPTADEVVAEYRRTM